MAPPQPSAQRLQPERSKSIKTKECVFVTYSCWLIILTVTAILFEFISLVCLYCVNSKSFGLSVVGTYIVRESH
jgi:hypothetical protein